MANEDHLKHLTSKYGHWNEWRVQNPNTIPDLRGADLSGQLLIGLNLSDAILDRTNLNRADLRRTDLTRASIRNANIYDAHFNNAILEETDLCGSVIIRSSFPKAQFSGTKLRAEIQKVSFQNASFRGTDLSRVRFHECDFYGADLADTNLSDAMIDNSSLMGTDFSRANMDRIDLSGTKLVNAILRDCRIHNAKLINTSMVQTDLSGADITGCEVYGTSVWDVAIDETTKQNDLIVQRRGGPKVIVDDIEVAQFIYLLLRREKIRNIIDTITSKAVLILGRFTPQRKAVLDALSDELRQYDLLPILFDFESSVARDFTETIRILAGMSLFVIADVSNPKSLPLELQATVPDYRIPFIPIIQEGEQPFAMLADLKKYDWVLEPVLTYSSVDTLREGFKSAILDRAWEKHHELQKARADRMKMQSVEDFIGGRS